MGYVQKLDRPYATCQLVQHAYQSSIALKAFLHSTHDAVCVLVRHHFRTATEPCNFSAVRQCPWNEEPVTYNASIIKSKLCNKRVTSDKKTQISRKTRTYVKRCAQCAKSTVFSRVRISTNWDTRLTITGWYSFNAAVLKARFQGRRRRVCSSVSR